MRYLARTDPELRTRLLQAAPTLLLGLGAIVVAVVLACFGPNAAGSILPPCPFRMLTGWLCPGCGSTRALHALLHGDLVRAVSMNPLLVIASPMLAWMALNAAGANPPGHRLLVPWLANPKLWLAVLLGYGVLHNLPWMPFAWLAPG